jgi:hypothetical protein
MKKILKNKISRYHKSIKNKLKIKPINIILQQDTKAATVKELVI